MLDESKTCRCISSNGSNFGWAADALEALPDEGKGVTDLRNLSRFGVDMYFCGECCCWQVILAGLAMEQADRKVYFMNTIVLDNAN